MIRFSLSVDFNGAITIEGALTSNLQIIRQWGQVREKPVALLDPSDFAHFAVSARAIFREPDLFSPSGMQTVYGIQPNIRVKLHLEELDRTIPLLLIR